MAHEQQEAFFTAAEKGDLGKINRLLLKKGLKIDVRDGSRNTALHAAAREGHDKVVRALLDAGANPNAQNWSKMTPLHYAARNGHTRVVDTLSNTKDIALNAYAREPGSDYEREYTPLHYAAKGGHHQIVCILLEAGADCSRTVTKTPFHMTAESIARGTGHDAIAEDLARAGMRMVDRPVVQQSKALAQAGMFNPPVQQSDPHLAQHVPDDKDEDDSPVVFHM